MALVLLFPGGTPADSAQTHSLRIGTESYEIELATTPAERSKGLMYRQDIDPRGGMLLVYRRPGNHRIWMKNVPIPLRVYWIDRSFEVVGAQRLEPCPADPCPIYSAAKPSLYVLELADRDHDLQPGDRISGLDSLPP